LPFDSSVILRFKNDQGFRMNKWFLLLVLIGVGVAGWMNRETVSGWLGHKTTDQPSEPTGPATPHPATESRALATRTYPALAVPGSPFNIRFLALYNDARASNPGLLTEANWPMQLAERTAKLVGNRAMPTPAANQFGSQLDMRPGGTPGATVPPSVALPGLKGSSLDQRPVPGKNGH
jgi:hypothetical protein